MHQISQFISMNSYIFLVITYNNKNENEDFEKLI